MKQGGDYIFSFYVGFGKPNPRNNSPSAKLSPSPLRLSIFGHANCSTAFPYDKRPSLGCPSLSPDWVELGTATLYGKEEWVQGNIRFTAPFDINAITIGPACGPVPDLGSDHQFYYYLDQVALAPKTDFNFKLISVLSGEPCVGNYRLQAPLHPSATYQWYRNGKAITGATAREYQVHDNPADFGDYTAGITIPNGCFTTLPYRVSFSPINAFTLGSDTAVCFPANMTLNAQRPYLTTFQWQDGSTQSDFNVNRAGTYWVEVKDQYGCRKRDTVNVSVRDCGECSVLVPSSFTPNGDGRNDAFRGRPSCQNMQLKRYRLSIYNRWGQKVFQSADPAKGWDGNGSSRPQPAGTYVYLLEYSYGQSGIKTTRGTVTLLR